MEAYLEDNRSSLDEVCDSQNECSKEYPAYRFCHPQAESEVMNEASRHR